MERGRSLLLLLGAAIVISALLLANEEVNYLAFQITSLDNSSIVAGISSNQGGDVFDVGENGEDLLEEYTSSPTMMQFTPLNATSSPSVDASVESNVSLRSTTSPTTAEDTTGESDEDTRLVPSLNGSYDKGYQLFVPKRHTARPVLKAHSLSEEYADTVKVSCVASDPEDAKKWEVCDPPKCIVNSTRQFANYVRTTEWGENTGEFVDRVLRKAWGPDPPVIDLYLRTYCPGFSEMSLMLESIEVFWPRFLGHIIIVLDYGNEDMVKELFPKHLRSHSYRIVYEHGHCMHGRVYSQYSYLSVGRHSQADYVVTFDSDCAFFHPVTPDLLFTKYKRKMIMPTSQIIVTTDPPGDSNFDEQQFFFTKVHDGPYGSAMVTQPVSFKLSTFTEFLQWIQKTRGQCYERLAARFARSTDWRDYRKICWMCQMGVFVAVTKHPDYDVHILNRRPDPYLRFATHYQYEVFRENKHLTQVETVSEAIQQGLCAAFGPTIFPACKTVGLTYVTRLRTHYMFDRLNFVSSPEEIEDAERALFTRLKRATELAMQDKT